MSPMLIRTVPLAVAVALLATVAPSNAQDADAAFASPDLPLREQGRANGTGWVSFALEVPPGAAIEIVTAALDFAAPEPPQHFGVLIHDEKGRLLMGTAGASTRHPSTNEPAYDLDTEWGWRGSGLDARSAFGNWRNAPDHAFVGFHAQSTANESLTLRVMTWAAGEAENRTWSVHASEAVRVWNVTEGNDTFALDHRDFEGTWYTDYPFTPLLHHGTGSGTQYHAAKVDVNATLFAVLTVNDEDDLCVDTPALMQCGAAGLRVGTEDARAHSSDPRGRGWGTWITGADVPGTWTFTVEDRQNVGHRCYAATVCAGERSSDPIFESLYAGGAVGVLAPA